MLQLENDKDILNMCRICIAHLAKDVHAYFEHTMDDFLNLVGGVLDEVVVNQIKDRAEGIDAELDKEFKGLLTKFKI